MGTLAPVSGWARPDFLLLLRGYGRLAPAVSVLGINRAGSVLPLRQPACADLVMPTPGLLCLDASFSASELATLGSILLLHSSAWPGPLPSVLEFCNAGSTFPAQGSACMGSLAPAVGMSCCGSVFPSSVTDNMKMGSLLLLRSFARPGFCALVLAWLRLEPLLFLRSYTRLSSFMSCLGLARAGSVSSLSVTELANMASSMFARSFACLGLLPPTLQYTVFSSSVSVRYFARIEPPASTLAASRTELSASVADSAHSGLTSLARSVGWMGSVAPVLQFSHTELSPSARTHACGGPSVSVLGLSRAGLVSSPPVTSVVNLEPLLPLQTFARPGVLVIALNLGHLGVTLLVRSLSCLGSMLLALDSLHLEFSFSPRAAGRPGLSMMVTGRMTFGSPLSALDSSHLELTVLVQSRARPGSSLSVPQFGHSGSFTAIRSMSHLGLPVFSLGLSRVGFVFPLLVTEKVQLESLLLPRSPSCLGAILPVPNYGRLGPLMLLRACAQLGLLVFVSGLACTDSVSALLVTGAGLLESSLLARSLACSDVAASVHDCSNLGLVAPLRSFA